MSELKAIWFFGFLLCFNCDSVDHTKKGSITDYISNQTIETTWQVKSHQIKSQLNFHFCSLRLGLFLCFISIRFVCSIFLKKKRQINEAIRKRVSAHGVCVFFRWLIQFNSTQLSSMWKQGQKFRVKSDSITSVSVIQEIQYFFSLERKKEND